jgi:class 3 adenylate cyclase
VGVDEDPETQYAWAGPDRVAYQVCGAGDVDVLFTVPSGDSMEMRWYWPPYADFIRRLGSNARVIMFDRRGMGSSEPASGETMPSWEQWADDARAVLDAAGSTRAVVLGTYDGGHAGLLFAASHPQRTRGLILVNTAASLAPAQEDHLHPWRNQPAGIQEFIRQSWGSAAIADITFPDSARDPAFMRWALSSMRLACSPREAGALFAEQSRMDVRHVLTSVKVPTLVLHRNGCPLVPVGDARYLAEHIPGARFVGLPGRDLHPWMEPAEPCVQSIEDFLADLHEPSHAERALAAILFTDFVGSTEHLSTVGDQAWRNLLDSHDVVARTVVEQHAGNLLKTTGDGILATFDGPGRAIRCATALRDALRPLGIEIRAGLHTGEVENRGTDIAGIAVHIAARVLDAAAAGELWVSAAVPMLVAGAGFTFEDRGEHELKGIDGTWHLFSVGA